MIRRGLTDEECKAAADAVMQYGGVSQASRAIGMIRETLAHRYKMAAVRGFVPVGNGVMPGFEISRVSTRLDANGEVIGQSIQQKPGAGETFSPPPGHTIKGVSALLDPDDRVLAKWVKTKEGGVSLEDALEAIKSAFDDVKPAKPVAVAKQAAFNDDVLSLLPCNDWHIGAFSWGKETGIDWDLKIAEEKIGDAACRAVMSAHPSGLCVVLGGGDLFHSDNSSNRTNKSGNELQVDGRYPKVMQVSCRLKVRVIDAALARHKRVIVRILPGNHDEHSAYAVAYYLEAYYRNEPRVTIDLDPGLFWFYRFHKVMLAAHHGHMTKMERMPIVMASTKPDMWGETTHRYSHTFHLHHSKKIVDEVGGVICEIHRAPVAPDAWHYSSGYRSGRSISCIEYHAEEGERARHVVAL